MKGEVLSAAAAAAAAAAASGLPCCHMESDDPQTQRGYYTHSSSMRTTPVGYSCEASLSSFFASAWSSTVPSSPSSHVAVPACWAGSSPSLPIVSCTGTGITSPTVEEASPSREMEPALSLNLVGFCLYMNYYREVRNPKARRATRYRTQQTTACCARGDRGLPSPLVFGFHIFKKILFK